MKKRGREVRIAKMSDLLATLFRIDKDHSLLGTVCRYVPRRSWISFKVPIVHYNSKFIGASTHYIACILRPACMQVARQLRYSTMEEERFEQHFGIVFLLRRVIVTTILQLYVNIHCWLGHWPSV